MRRSAPYFVLFLVAVVMLWRPIFSGDALLPGGYLSAMSPWSGHVKTQAPQWNALQWDALAEFYPWRLHYAQSMRHGMIPYWNPYQLSGTPFAANGQSAVFYPLNIIFLLFDPITAFTASALLHMFLAGAFMYLLARRLGMGMHSSTISGLIYAFSAFIIVWLELPTFVSVAAWLPLVLFLSMIAYDRKSLAMAAWAGVALGMCVLAGHLQIAFYCWMMVGLWWLWLLWTGRREGKLQSTIKMAVVTGVVAFLIAAPQAFPTMELARMSHRVRPASSLGYSQFVANGVPAANLITMLVPDFFGNPSSGDYWMGNAATYTETALYVSVLGLFLTAMGVIYAFRRKGAPAFFTAVALGSLLIAFGTPLNALFYYLLPGFSALGGPNRIIVIYTFAAAILAGYGADWVGGACAGPESPACDRAGRLPVWSVAPAFAGVTMLFVAAWFVVDSKLQQLAGVSVSEAAFAKARPALLMFTAFFALSLFVLFIRACGGIERRSFLRLCIALVVVDLLAFGMGYNAIAPRRDIYPETPGIRALKKIAGDGTVAMINWKWSLYDTPDAVLPPNAAMVYGLRDAGGYDSLFLRSYKDLVDNLQGEDTSPVENGNMVFFKRYAPALESIADVFVSKDPLNASSLSEEYSGEFYIYRVRGRDISEDNRRVWSNPNREPSELVKENLINYPGWKVDRNGFVYRPGSIRLGIFMMLLGVALTGFLTVWDKARTGDRR